MKKFSICLLTLISVSVSANADKYIISFDNVQKVKKIECIKGLYYVVADVDDNENERIPLYKIVNNTEIQATCSNQNVQNAQAKDQKKGKL